MLRVELTPEERAQLEHTFKTTSDRRLRDRCQAVLMANRGRKRKLKPPHPGSFRYGPQPRNHARHRGQQDRQSQSR